MMTQATHQCFILCLLFLIALIAPETYCCNKECEVDSIPLQEHFNPRLFQGLWYLVSANRGIVDLPFASSLLTPRNVQLLYTMNTMGNINLTMSGSMVGPFCDYMTGYAVFQDRTRPEMMSARFSSWFPPAARLHTYVVLRTDYEYAVIYSCREKDTSGCCRQNKAFIWTFNRRRKGHTFRQKAEIDEAIKSACLVSSHFYTYQQDGLCPVDASHTPDSPGLIFVISGASVGFIILVICFTCCLTKMDNKTKLKKEN